ncbi:MAG: hypothetical protein L0Y70_09010 [Gemmataceae bacterium]|nr:hypothetical protein [Gemmataceae bacterium]
MSGRLFLGVAGLYLTATAFAGRAPAQPQLAEPQGQVRPVDGDLEEAIRRQLREGQMELHEMRQKEFEDEDRGLGQDAISRLDSAMKKREVVRLRKDALDRLFSAVLSVALATFFVICSAVTWKKLKRKPPKAAE